MNQALMFFCWDISLIKSCLIVIIDSLVMCIQKKIDSGLLIKINVKIFGKGKASVLSCGY